MNVWLEGTKVCLEVTGNNQEKFEAMDLESNREETEAVEDHQEVCNKEAAAEIIGVLKNRSRNQHLTMGYQNPRKRWAKDDDV